MPYIENNLAKKCLKAVSDFKKKYPFATQDALYAFSLGFQFGWLEKGIDSPKSLSKEHSITLNKKDEKIWSELNKADAYFENQKKNYRGINTDAKRRKAKLLVIYSRWKNENKDGKFFEYVDKVSGGWLELTKNCGFATTAECRRLVMKIESQKLK